MACMALSIALSEVQQANAQTFKTDLTVTEVTTTPSLRTITTTKYFSGDAIRSTSTDGTDYILRYDTRKVIILNNTKRTYTEITFDQLNVKSDSLTVTQAVAAKESREAAFLPQGPGETIVGYATDRYVLLQAPLKIEVSVAPAFKEAEASYESIRARGPQPALFDAAKLLDKTTLIKGATLKTVVTMTLKDKTDVSTTITTGVDKAKIAASKFEVPSGYTLAKLKW
jgi:hypothetical protein